MNTNASSPSTDVTTCRQCGEVFNRALSACPACGASRHRRHKSRSSRYALSDTWQLWLQQVRVFVLRKKYYFIYILLGVFAGAILRPIVMFLAAFSMPEGWRHARALGMQPFSLQHFFEPFIAAAQTLGRWTVQGVVGAVTWVYETVANLIVMYPSAMVMAVIGAAIGFWMARRRHQAVRNTNRRRGASARVVPSVGLAEPPTPVPGVGPEPRAGRVDEPQP